MAAVDDVIGAIETIISTLGDVDQEFGKAESEADEAIEKAEAVGDPGPVGQFAEIQSSLRELRERLSALKEGTDEILSAANAIKSGA